MHINEGKPMICPNCTHTMNDNLAYCERCGAYLAAPQPKTRVVPMSTYRFDLHDQPGGNDATSVVVQQTTAFYSSYEPVFQPVAAAAPGTACVPTSARRTQRRSGRMRALFTMTVASMLLLGFSSGMTAFATDEADNRMPLVVEYEEAFTSEAFEVSIEAEEAEVETTPDDPAPIAAPPSQDSAPAMEFSFVVEPEADIAPETALIASTLEQPQTEPTSEPLAPCTLDVNGTRVPYVHSVFAPVCPDNDAALWAGDDDTTDGSYGYFIGHNPGDFACVYALVPGDHVTLCDANGNLRAYTVAQLYDVPNTIFFHEVVEKLIPQGESLVMQTCIGDGSTYRIVVCQ